jgi:hypothetical protein
MQLGPAEYGGIIVAVLAASGAWLNARFGRMARLEDRVTRSETVNNRLWAYMRAQHDHCYRHGGTPLPIPEDLYKENE